MTIVDLAFPLQSVEVARDHGYLLFSAICTALPGLHDATWLGVHPLSGRPVAADTLRLGRGAALRLRLPADQIGAVLSLAGRTLSVGAAKLTPGAPSVHALAPAASVDSRLVVVKLTDVPRRQAGSSVDTHLDVPAMGARTQTELRRQLARMGISAQVKLCGHGRLRVAGKQVVGFSVRVAGLTPEQSLLLQEHGLGGKRHMGCGIFRPTRGN